MKTGNKKSKHPIVKITLLSIIVIVIKAGIKEDRKSTRLNSSHP